MEGDADRHLDGLDDDQRRAVLAPSPLLAVVAGAGSGKTRVLTRRIAHRVAAGEADARHTLVLTFTREAAGELWRRLPALGLHEPVTAGTFHSVALRLVRERWADRGRPVPRITADRSRLVNEAVGGRVDEILPDLDWAAVRGLGPDDVVATARAAGRRLRDPRRVSHALRAYTELKRTRGVIDLDDVLGLLVSELRRDREFAASVRWRYRHLFVDEAQDLNPLQHQLLDELRRDRDDLCLVGDPAQAIYAFNGSDPDILVDVARHFPGIEIVRLPVNHRCTPQVVEIARHVLVTSGQRSSVASGRLDGATVTVRDFDDEHTEAAGVATMLAELHRGDLAAGRVAVLARTHAQLRVIREALESRSIPVSRPGRLADPEHRAAIAEAARLDHAALRAWAHDLLDLAGTDEVPLDGALARVAGAALQYLRDEPLADGSGFRAWIATADPFDDARTAGVELLTFHGAKGREWPVVFVAGAESGLVPHKSATSNAARAEEARLLYVALTRATERLTVTWAARRGGYRRQRTSLLDEYEPDTAPTVPPPAALARPTARRDRAPLDALLGWRADTARAAGIVPEQVCSEHALRAIAASPPADVDELAAITGWGRITASHRFDAIVGRLEPTAAEPADTQSRRSTITGA